MTIQALYRVQCQPCERYLADEHTPGTTSNVTVNSSDSPLFLTFASAYDEAVRHGWSAYPLLCPDCAADLMRRIRGGEVRRDGDPPEDRRRIPEGGQGAE